MSASPIDPLPPDLAELFAREARGYPDDPALESRVLKHVEMAVALSAPAPLNARGSGVPGAAGAGTVGAAKLAAIVIATFALGAVVGGATVARRASTPPAPPSAPASAAALVGPAPSSPTPSLAVPPPPVASAPPSADVAATPTPRATAPLASAQNPAAGDLVRERELLDVARAALARGRSDDAIAAVERHARRWPRGYLGEERDVLWIQALAAEGRHDEASRRADQFKRSYPRSMLTPAVDSALVGSP